MRHLHTVEVHPCGYAPRVLRRWQPQPPTDPGEMLFIGLKDGSVTMLSRTEPGVGNFTHRRLPLQAGGETSAGVRALQPLGSDWLIVGRNNGYVDFVRWRDALTGSVDRIECHSHGPLDPPPPGQRGPVHDESLRYATWLDQGRLLVSYRHAGTRVLAIDEGSGPGSFGARLKASVPIGDVGGVWQAFRIGGQLSGSGRFLLIDQRGALWIWEWAPGTEVARPRSLFKGRWSGDLPPALVEDVTRVGPPWDDFQGGRPKKELRAVILTADSGIYAIDLRSVSWHDGLPEPRRMLLPGVGAAGMAVTYVEVGEKAFLWLATRDGACHLFENAPLDTTSDFLEWVSGFRRSGQAEVAAQVLVAHAWADNDSIWLATADRDDKVRIYLHTLDPGGSSVPRPGGALASPGAMIDTWEMLAGKPESSDDDKLHLLRRFVEEGARQTTPGALPTSGSAATPGPELTPCVPEPPPYAWLAWAFEKLAGDDDRRLFEFLSAPETSLANALLRLSCRTADEQQGIRPPIEKAIDLWSLCLVGLVNVQRRPREEWYLGILRFLRGLEAPCDSLSFDRAIDKAIRFATKWGLYGDVNQMRQDLVVPLQILQHERGGGAAGAPQSDSGPVLDALTYSVLLFRRSYSVVNEDRAFRQKGTAGRALATLEVAQGTLVAVVWNRSGTYLGLLARDAPDGSRPPELSRLQLPAELEASPETDDSQYRYGRSVLLLRADEVRDALDAGPDDFFLLTASRQDSLTSPREELHLWHLQPDLAKQGCTLVSRRNLDASDEETSSLDQESIYCLIRLDKGLVAAGLLGSRGRAMVALFAVSAKSPLRLLRRVELRPGLASVEAESLSRNRVFSLARVGLTPRTDGEAAGSATFLAGCENGEIWKVRVELAGGQTGQPVVHRVASLAAPVTALACRQMQVQDGSLLRIFAGAQDGTLIGFQQETTRDENSFATLWATAEQAPIVVLDQKLYDKEGQVVSMLLAVDRKGVSVAIDDRDEMAEAEPIARQPQGRPRRSAAPGIRRFRAQLACSCFAGGAFDHAWNPGRQAWRFLATASGNGDVTVVSFHLPRYTVERKAKFASLLDNLWASILARNGRPEYLRLVEAVYRAAPLFMLIPVRWLLDPDRQDDERDGGRLERLLEIEDWWVPRSLLPLFRLRQAWGADADPEAINERLRELLRSAWQQGDPSLFQEICTLVLKRLNYSLFRGGKAQAQKDLYFAVIKAIEASLTLWIGGPDEMPVRSVVAKNLVDGDTYWQLLCRVEDPLDPDRSLWKEILNKRIEGVRQLVFKEDVLLSIEALRAANQSLLQLCRRLADARRALAGTDLTAVSWDVFEHYFRQLAFGAARALQLKPRLSDVLYHDYARTFALCLCACPEGVVPMLRRLAEAQLIVDPDSPNDLAQRIRGQLIVLDRSFDVRSLPGMAELLVRILRPQLDDLDEGGWFEHDFRQSVNKWPAWTGKPLARIGEAFAELGRSYAPVRDLRALAHNLSTEARDLGLLSRARIDEVLCSFDETRLEEHFQHSLDFWRKALSSLKPMVDWERAQPDEKIRPEVVLLSYRVAGWAREQEEELRRRYKNAEIFQPQYHVFGELLQRVRAAAEGFARGAAVQKNLVVGILNHHLLEDLDLHVFELREIARNLDPLGLAATAQPRLPVVGGEAAGGTQAGRGGPTGSRFASLLVRRAQQALSLPKHLRALAYVLELKSGRQERLGDIVQLAAGHGGWDLSKLATDAPAVEAEASTLLALVMRELHQNHQAHSGVVGISARPRVHFGGGVFEIECPVNVEGELGKDRWQRLKSVQQRELQQPLSPSPDHRVASTGVGLYMSSLAAAIAGWQLRMEPPGDRGNETVAWFSFTLKRVHPAPAPQPAAKDASGVTAPAEVIRGSYRNLVVVDDKPAVALYLWREAGDVTGFGSAEVATDEAQRWFEKDGKPVPIESPGGEPRIWWVRADGEWKERIAAVLHEIGDEAGSLFLVDVRGPVEEDHYDVTEVLKLLASGTAGRRDIRLISSYRQGISVGGRRIEAKTPETFQSIAVRAPEVHSADSEMRHVLITGAGFEMAGVPDSLRLGVPPTRALLSRWIVDEYGAAELEDHPEQTFPMPRALWDWVQKSTESHPQFELDKYFEELFRFETRSMDAFKAAQHEYQRREGLRQQFLRYDWGYLNQALAAAQLDWTAWLSTNYTRFSNRAIDRVQPSGLDMSAKRTWQTIEIKEEAERLQHVMLHDDAIGKELFAHRWLFKLHGDIGHVLTMALSAGDKTFSTHLPSFSPLYFAARTFLLERARRQPPEKPLRWIWHVVGHGLNDRLLVEQIKAICKHGQVLGQAQVFVVVDLSAAPAERLRSELLDAMPGVEPDVRPLQMTAERYLTGLLHAGLDRFEDLLAPPA